jgi:phage gp36-like protein
MYCTQQDLITRFGEEEIIDLTDKQYLGEIDDDVVDRAIADTDALIDSYLGGRFKAALNPVPMVVNRLACDLVRYQLYDDLAPEQVQNRHKDAIKILEQIRDGKMSIGLTEEGDKTPSNNQVEMQVGGSVFGRGNGGLI